GLEKWLTFALCQVENAFVDGVHIKRTEKAAGSDMAQVNPKPAHEFISDKGIEIVVFAGAETQMLKIFDVVIGEEPIIEFGNAVIAVEINVEARLFGR